MTHYDKAGAVVNQLDTIIRAVRTRANVNTAAYTVLIQNPGGETVRPLGGPCLNYIAVQLDTSPQLTLGLLAVYRNHDFLERAYGNYWGLCNLLRFLAAEVGAAPGPLTCVSSHAYVPDRKVALRQLVDSL
jgi:thymidylate synthase